MMGMVWRLWIIQNISRAKKSMTELTISKSKEHDRHHYYHNDKAKVTIAEIKPRLTPRFTEPVDCDMI